VLGLLTELFELNRVGKGSLSGLIPIEIGASELRVLKASQGLCKGWPMIKVAQMDSFVEENVVKGVRRGQGKAI
jgi:hypothetical protein